MASIDGINLQRAASMAPVQLAPAVGEGDGLDIGTARRFGPFAVGDYVVVVSQGAFFMRTGGSSVDADATSTPLPAGIFGFTIPTGVTHVSLFASSSTQAAAWKG